MVAQASSSLLVGSSLVQTQPLKAVGGGFKLLMALGVEKPVNPKTVFDRRAGRRGTAEPFGARAKNAAG